MEVRSLVGDKKHWPVQPWQHGVSRLLRVSWRCIAWGELWRGSPLTKRWEGGWTKAMGRQSLHHEGPCLGEASLTPVSYTIKRGRTVFPISALCSFHSSLSDSDPQMDSCSPPLPWTGTASQTQSTSSWLFPQRILLQVSAAPSFTACWAAGLCPGRSLWTSGTSGHQRGRRHQGMRDVKEKEGKKEEEGNHGWR